MIYIIDCFTGFEKLGELTSLKSLNLTSNRLEGTIHINGEFKLKSISFHS